MVTGDAKIILQPDSEPAILDLKRQAAADCRVKHGMTVILDDTTEYDLQSNGLSELAVRKVQGVARSSRWASSPRKTSARSTTTDRGTSCAFKNVQNS